MVKRPTNLELAANFRELLTKRFYVVNDDGEVLEGEQLDKALTATKPWRNELWKAFRIIEERLDPMTELAREKNERKAKS